MARISQVLINLVSNAIKFTAKAEGQKEVVVSVGASVQRPTSYPPNVVFFTSEDHAYRMDATNSPDSGAGAAVYLMVAVIDTGIGISDEDQQRLFERFRVGFSRFTPMFVRRLELMCGAVSRLRSTRPKSSTDSRLLRQATPKTVEIYGGSGLGLNISRKLCHVHGGEVGVSSQPGCGSTFGFFFKVKRTERPQDHESALEGQEVDSAPFRRQIKELGNDVPKETDPDIFSESLENPPIIKTGDTVAHSDHQYSERYKHVAHIASSAQEVGIHQDMNGRIVPPDGQVRQSVMTGPTLHSLKNIGEDIYNQATPASTHAPEPSAQAHLLLVEDNIVNQKVVLRKLEHKGYSVTVANNGREAVEILKSAPKPSTGDKQAFRICLMDMEMPMMDGNTATKVIRELELQGKIEHIPILGVTANVRDEQQAEM